MKTSDAFRPAARFVWETLKNNGYEAFLIGGSVRDYIMGRAVGDIDITTNAVPCEVERIFSQCRVIETGIKHGTVTVMWDGDPVEITTYRSESGYSDNRHPDSVTFSDSLKEDVFRRDFTMNGVAFDFETGFCDLVGGIDDIQNKIIRCIGDPEERFREDALRILRALRFSAVLGFSIDDATKTAIHSCRELLKNISAERLREETVKLICGENAGAVLLEFPDVIGVFIPEMLSLVGFDQHNRHHIYDAYEHTVRALTASLPEPLIRLALMFHDLGKPSTVSTDENGEFHFYGHPSVSAGLADSIMKRLRFDNKTRENTVRLIEFHDFPIMCTDGNASDRKRVKKLMSQMGADLIYDLAEIKRCDNFAHAPQYILPDSFYEELHKIIDNIISDDECLKLKDLKINGNDLVKMGFQGKEIGKALKKVLSAVVGEQLPNDRDALLQFVGNEHSKLHQ